MKPSQRIVVSLPLTELWNDAGPLDAKLVRELSSDDLRRLLKRQATPIVVADVSQPLHWVSATECFDFWKSEIRPHLAEPAVPLLLDRFPGGYAYWASEWSLDGASVVVLEKTH